MVQVSLIPRQVAAAARSIGSTPHVVCLFVGLTSVLILCFLTPPFEVPDEPQHFFRSYQLSELQLWGTLQDGAAGAVLPSSLVNLVENFLGTSAIFDSKRAIRAQPFGETWSKTADPLNPEDREFVDFSGAVSYSPLAYAPQVLGIWVGRSFGAPPLMLLYLARLANGVAAVLAMAWALKMLPVGKGAGLAAALLPMAQFEYASASPDAAIISSVFVFTAVALRASAAGTWRIGDVIACAVSGTVFTSVKVVYAPLLLVGLAGCLRQIRAGRPAKAAFSVQMLIALGAILTTAAWLASVSHLLGAYRAGADPSAQVFFIFAHPAEYAGIVWHSIVHNFRAYLRSGVGQLGWLTIFLPGYAYFLAAVAFAVSPLTECSRPCGLGLAQTVWNMLLFTATVILIETAIYLYWSPVGAPEIKGVQGRYFIPLLPLLVATLADMTRTAGHRLFTMLPSTEAGGPIRPTFYWVPSVAYAMLVFLIVANTLTMHIVIENVFRIL